MNGRTITAELSVEEWAAVIAALEKQGWQLLASKVVSLVSGR